MASKALFLLALLASAAVLTTAAEQPHDTKETNKEANDMKDGHGHGHGGGGHGGGGGYYCKWGCCHKDYHGGCLKCCKTPDEVKN